MVLITCELNNIAVVRVTHRETVCSSANTHANVLFQHDFMRVQIKDVEVCFVHFNDDE